MILSYLFNGCMMDFNWFQASLYVNDVLAYELIHCKWFGCQKLMIRSTSGYWDF